MSDHRTVGFITPYLGGVKIEMVKEINAAIILKDELEGKIVVKDEIQGSIVIKDQITGVIDE